MRAQLNSENKETPLEPVECSERRVFKKCKRRKSTKAAKAAPRDSRMCSMSTISNEALVLLVMIVSLISSGLVQSSEISSYSISQRQQQQSSRNNYMDVISSSRGSDSSSLTGADYSIMINDDDRPSARSSSYLILKRSADDKDAQGGGAEPANPIVDEDLLKEGGSGTINRNNVINGTEGTLFSGNGSLGHPETQLTKQQLLQHQAFQKRLMELKQKYMTNRAISDQAYYVLLFIYSLFIVVGTISNSLICLTVSDQLARGELNSHTTQLTINHPF